ncbi:major facilitator superfamily domain-containing protein [Cyathus striatus]|nr:major facilitator superfamily domain-containing protein [Cyathus striatus]
MALSDLHIPSMLQKIPGAARVKLSSRSSSMLPSTSWQTSSNATSTQQNAFTAETISPIDIVDDENSESRLPSIKSLAVVIAGNALFQLSFFIAVPSASLYVEYLGGTPTFSGLVLGIPTAISGIALLVVKRFDGGQYRRPFVITYISAIVGNAVYALAYTFNFLYLLLIARMILGISFTSFMFSRKYCTDPRLVGIRRRTTLASWYVLGPAFGFSVGTWVGGMLYKIGSGNTGFFNGYTAPGWVMAGVWLAFLVVSGRFFEDVPKVSSGTRARRPAIGEIEMNSLAVNVANEPAPSFFALTLQQKCLLLCMCYSGSTFFFVLSSWESNIPIFTAARLGYSPYQAGNFIAMSGAATFLFLFLNVRYAYRFQDRVILATGTSLGLLGLFVLLAILITDTVHFGSLFVAWFLVALGFNLASTCTLSLLSKQMPGNWNAKASMAIQYSNYAGRLTGAVMGGAGVKIGMEKYAAIQIAMIGIGIVMHLVLWTELKVKTG